MADDKKSNAPKPPQEEPILARLKSGPSQTPTGVTTFVGLLGRSPKPGYWLLYLSLDMSRSVEIQEADIILTESLAPDQSPFGGLGGTRVFVKQDAQVTTTQTASQTQDASAAAADEFDLDIRLGAAGGAVAAPKGMLTKATCPHQTCRTECVQHTCLNTQCGQLTCAATCGQRHTCVDTQCAQHTCVNTQCAQHTCAGTCAQHTCAFTCVRAVCIGTAPPHTCLCV